MVMVSLPNAKRLKAVLARITHPKYQRFYDQTELCSVRTKVGGYPPNERGTFRCFLGWAQAMYGKNKKYRGIKPGEVREALNLNRDQYEALFNGGNSPKDIKNLVALFSGDKPGPVEIRGHVNGVDGSVNGRRTYKYINDYDSDGLDRNNKSKAYNEAHGLTPIC